MFHFKQFSIKQADSAMKVGTDAMILGAVIDCSNKTRCLDIGAGTGVLSLMMAQQNSDIKIDAVEIDELSAKECQDNFQNSPWFERLIVNQLDFLDYSSEKKYDLIFSNPPYYSTTNLNEDVRKAQARHVESLPVREMILKIKTLLTVDGEFWVIFPHSEKTKWFLNAESTGLRVKTAISIRGKAEKEANRVILCFNRSAIQTEEKEFVVRNVDNSYTKEYIELTNEFHSIDLRK
ncbi:MAG: methyltransferase [Fluviicola sp.]|nr:methyltransferase [Fluviicola sp.]